MNSFIAKARFLAMLSFATLPLAVALAQDPQPEALPPPAIDDPGVKAQIEPAAVSDNDGVEEAPATEPTPSAPLPVDDNISLPVVTVRTDPQTGDRVEETRVDGKLIQILVQPKNAQAYILHDANGDGRVDAKDAEGPVQPVYFKLFEWK